MALTIKILKMNEVSGLGTNQQNVIGSVEYKITSDTSKRSITGFANLDFSELTEENFIPFDQLTEETVKGWVAQCIGSERLAAIEAQLNSEPEIALFSYNEIDLPWKN